MNERQLLQTMLLDARFLVLDVQSGRVELRTPAGALQAMHDRDAAGLVMDLGRALVNFVALVGPGDRTFDSRELEKICGRPQATVWGWVDGGVIRPSVQRGQRGRFRGGKRRPHKFSFFDGFVGGVAGALSRQGIGAGLLLEVSRLLYGLRAEAVRAESDQVAGVAQ